MNEVAIGLTVPHFALALARHRLSPPGFARVTTAAMFAPEQALAAGYLDAVVDDSQLRSTVADAATQFLALNRESYAGTKARINAAVLRAVREGWEMDQRRPVGT